MSAYRYSNNYLLIELHIYSNGNLLEELTNNVVTTTNTYNERNELISTTKDNETFEYEYNAEGKRISKSDGTDIVKFIYEGKNIILEVDESDEEIASNIYGLALVKRETEDEEGYYLYNGHADTITIVDEEGTILNTYEYDAFGTVINETGTFDNPYKYSGYYYDSSSGLYYLMSRYYNPSIARFISEDTYRGELNDPLSLNRYVYVHNNPLIYYDPDGYFLHTIIIGGTSGIIGGVGKIASNVSNGEEWFEGVAGATIEGTIIGTSFSMCGPKCAIPGTYVGNVANQAWEDIINGNEIKIDQKEAITHTVVTTAAVVVGGIGGPVTTSGTARMIDVATKSFLAGTAADTTYQFMDYGITTNENGRITGYDIDKAIMNYDSVRAYKTGITSMVMGPIIDKGYTSLMDKYGPTSTWGRKETLEEHFGDHGKDFNAKNQNDYVKKANQFYKNRNQYDNFVGTDGNTRVYDVNTNTLGSYNPDGTTKTFMKPRSKHYWQNQINRYGGEK